MNDTLYHLLSLSQVNSFIEVVQVQSEILSIADTFDGEPEQVGQLTFTEIDPLFTHSWLSTCWPAAET